MSLEVSGRKGISPPLATVNPATIALEDIPAVIGALETLKAQLYARLSMAGPPASNGDRMLDVDEAATRTGMSTAWLYRHRAELSFARKIGRKLIFSEAGLTRWLARR